MDSRIKTLAVTFLVSATVVGGVYIADEPVLKTIEEPIIKGEVVEIPKVTQNTDLTSEEYWVYVDMMDYEMEQMGTIHYDDITSSADLINRLHSDIRDRVVNESQVDIGDETLTQEEYAALKGGLLDKFK